MLSIWENGTSESFLEAMKIPGQLIFSKESKLTWSMLKLAFTYTIGFKYFNATYKTSLGKFVFCLPIYKKSYFRDWKGLSKTEATILFCYLFEDKYLSAATAPIDLPQRTIWLWRLIFSLIYLIMDPISCD